MENSGQNQRKSNPNPKPL